MPLPSQLLFENLRLSGYLAVSLHGSYARGDQTSASDIDLHLVVPEGVENRFEVRAVEGFQVELHLNTFQQIEARLARTPAWAHSWVRAEHLAGEAGITEALQHQAQGILAAYRPDPQEIEGTRHWLASAETKLAAALARADLLYAGYLANTNTWELLSAFWYLNSLPVPASSLMFKLTPQLKHLPPDFASTFAVLCVGEGENRARAFLSLSHWASSELSRVLASRSD